MKPVPTASAHRLADHIDLVLPRSFRAPIDDGWAAITEPERTTRWFGPWEGDETPGRTIRVQMPIPPLDDALFHRIGRKVLLTGRQ
ncbi:hypothetical protein ATK30_6031 [Amycolatopsis echigonensis]|uniref:Activator of Hsp90 ATPase-like protein n=1 Tax=Amycolatopsis echigonensis TaxID=2576905 RepID=A0A2N3WMP1_9PSEU|nr:hypothetical protein ATK30_6031 [Amycolatopsis niigatensis]